jgi:PAB-dependent poly(A)-specific ribonuclease subunit 2
MPRHYRNVELKYSRFGVEEFDLEYVPFRMRQGKCSSESSLRFYNKTNYSGLKTQISNSYTNSLLQALHYTLPIRIVAKAHIAQDCPKESCLLCEAGLLFRMLEDAKGNNCQASNFSSAFSSSSQGAFILACYSERS